MELQSERLLSSTRWGTTLEKMVMVKFDIRNVSVTTPHESVNSLEPHLGQPPKGFRVGLLRLG